MANTIYGTITSSDYVDVETELEISFTSGTFYQIQVKNLSVVCEADTKPESGGFELGEKPFTYLHSGSKLWVKAKKPYLPITINIAEGCTFGLLNAVASTVEEG